MDLRGMTQAHVFLDSCTCVVWLIHMRDIMYSYVCCIHMVEALACCHAKTYRYTDHRQRNSREVRDRTA